MRIEYSIATTTNLRDKAEFLKRIQEIVLELQIIRGDVIEYLKDFVAWSVQYQSNSSDTRVRTSSTLPGKVYGRDLEKNKIIWTIKDAKSRNITVLPIVGILGVGKTTLAKLVYHDQHVKREFERIWVWVSNIFDEVRVTREILDVVTLSSHEGSRKNEIYEGVSNYSKLLEFLKQHMACVSNKFLLVLDDVYDCMEHSQWEDLLGALGSSCTNGNVIVVTTRNLSVAKRLGTVKPIELRALGNYDFLELIKACAFGDNNYKEHLDIGRHIATKLHGNPLAAESATDMFREQPTHHWKSIMKNGVWESLQFHGGRIMTALKITYNQLSYILQQCLLFCSIFPIGYLFHIDDLVYMWISSGFVKSVAEGQDYLNALVNSGFFENVETEDSILHHQRYYVMCGIMHEFARVVSRAEFATMDGLEFKEVLSTVRHFLIRIDSVYHGQYEKFEEKWKSIISSARRLRTLILIGDYHSLFFQSKSLHTFISNLINCTHLRYLKLEYKGKSESLPLSLSKFYHLQILESRCQAIHDMSDLISMRHLVLTKGACDAFSPAMSASLQTIHIEDCKGWQRIPSLLNLSTLTKLKLRNMPEVTELLIPSLEELVLIDMPSLEICFSKSLRDLNSSLRVLEIRRCHILKVFPLFDRCEVFFEIEQKSWLPNVSELTIHECRHLVVSNPLPPSSSICKLSIKDVSTLLTMEGSLNKELKISSFGNRSSIEFLDDRILAFHNLRTITQLEIANYENLFSISLQGFRQLICLKRLEIRSCQKLFSLDVHQSTHTYGDMAATNLDDLPSLECLSIVQCGITGQWLSVILQHVRALEKLRLVGCRQITGLLIEGKESCLSDLTLAPRALSQANPDDASTRPCPDKLLRVPSDLIPSLKKMVIEFCEFTFQGFSGFTSLEELIINGCSELISSLLHGDGIDDQANGRWLLPCSLGVLSINYASLGILQPCFSGDLTRLTVLKVWGLSRLKSLHLHSCTALEKLSISFCKSLDALEGLQSLRSLKNLEVEACPGLPQCLESLSMQGYELCPRLERLRVDDHSFLTMPFCRHLTSLQCLQFGSREDDLPHDFDVAEPGLTSKQEAALQLLASLQELRFACYCKLSGLPMALHSLPSLKRLAIICCPNISRLPNRGLPPSLEELKVSTCSNNLTEECRRLATTKLKVCISSSSDIEDRYYFIKGVINGKHVK